MIRAGTASAGMRALSSTEKRSRSILRTERMVERARLSERPSRGGMRKRRKSASPGRTGSSRRQAREVRPASRACINRRRVSSSRGVPLPAKFAANSFRSRGMAAKARFAARSRSGALASSRFTGAQSVPAWENAGAERRRARTYARERSPSSRRHGRRRVCPVMRRAHRDRRRSPAPRPQDVRIPVARRRRSLRADRW